ncbi:SpaA isopeptide-forming pilin-related protein [Thermophilibacter sp.]|uniref:SpaA isopeptide-forming pilin-related protein n=1 Tax=Thermophilibacter sp. TaxID=2847309 RepID=UPI003A945656
MGKKGRQSAARRAVALALTVILTFEALFSNGVSIAIAEEINETGGVSQQGLTLETTPEQGEGEKTDGTETEPTTEVESNTESATEPEPESETNSTPETETTPEDGDAGEPETEPAPRAVEAWDWTGRTDNLVLSADGLTVAEGTTLSEDDTLAAKLELSFSLDPAAEGVDTGDHTVIVPGDTFTVALPEGVTLQPDATLDVYQNDDQGNPTSVLVAKATAENDGAALKVTFVEPSDTAGSGTAYYVGAPTEGTEPAAQTEGRTQLASLAADLSLDVTLNGALLGEKPGELAWVLQTNANDPSITQVATLALPAAADVARPATEEELQQAADSLPAIEESAVESVNSIAAALPNALLSAARAEGETTYSLSDYTASDQMTITWCDNNYEGRPAPSEYGKLVLPQYSLDGGETWETLLNSVTGEMLDAAKEDLGITGDAPSWAKRPTVTQTTVGNWNVSMSGLPTTLTETTKTPTGEYDEHGNPTYTEKKKEAEIQWRLYDQNKLPEGYVYGDNDGGNTGDENGQTGQRYLMRTQTFTFNISGKLGDMKLEEAFGEDFASSEYAQYFEFGASINNQPQQTRITLARLMERFGADGRCKISYSDDGKTATIEVVMPMYDISGAPIVYDITYDEPQGGTTDYYQPAYNNSASPSHGSATDALYSGGTMTLRPMGTTTYDATKAWLDGGNQANRPETTFTLWRYSTNGSAATAAQVQLNETDQQGNPSASNGAVQYVSITVPKGSSNSVDLGKLLNEKYGDGTQDFLGSLPKYDPDGYPYIYALREDTDLPGYELVFGSVAADDTVSDTAPNYQDVDGDRVNLPAADRDNDPLIYNDGTLTNRLTGQVRVEATKTWEIAAFQDSLNDVTVTFTLQSRVAGSNAQWQDTNETIDVDGWKSETLTQTFGDTFPQYNAQGQELEYRWIETGVSVGGEAVDFTRDGNGGGTFTMSLVNIEGESEKLEFTSTFEEGEGEDDLDTITNTFKNVTEEHVDKFWEQPDGSMAQIKPQAGAYDVDHDVDFDGIATVQLFQDGKLIGTFSMDGTTDPQPTKIEDFSGDATVQETRSYHLDFNNLPKYSEDGVRHVYLVLETGKDGWHVDRVYDAETHTTTINNTIGYGEGSEIRLLKNWVDGDDSSHRLTVEVQLVARHDMHSDAMDADGKPLYSYTAGQTVLTTTLSAANSWYAEVDVPIGHLDYRDFRLVETALIVENDDGTTTRYPVVNRAGAADAYADINIDKNWINEGWDYDSTEDTWRVATSDHVYQVYANPDAQGEWNDDMDAVTATNRRLGLIDLTVTKTWKDGVNHDRPEAELVVSCIEEQGVFEIDDAGNVWAQLDGGSRVPVMNGNGDDARQLNSQADNITLDGDDLVIKVSTPDNESHSEFRLFGLPKYDGDGLVVHYDVTERMHDDTDVYSTSKTVGAYTVGPQHFHDQQQIDFTNRRSDTRDVTFNKHWFDHYVNDTLSQRPDIYLTLYRVTVQRGADGALTFSDPEQVPGYVHYLWTGVADSENPQYEQECTIAGLAAYDADGNEYVYYASESMSADGTALDYAPVQFDYTGMPSVIENLDEPEAVKVPGATQTSDDPEQDGTNWAIHEGGTFENRLTSTLVANGAKLWDNVPVNVGQADLPELTIYLQRREVGETSWPSLKFDVDENGNWSFADSTSAIAWTSELTMVATNEYTYAMSHTGENTSADIDADSFPEGATALERYTEDGTLYEYRAIEVPWGLLNQPGGPTEEFIETTDFSELRTQSGAQIGVVVIEHGETGSFLIHNRYESETGSLTVQKHYTGRDANDRYPDTTFDVYSYYVNEDGVASAPALVASKTLTNDDLSTPTTGDAANPAVTQNGDNTANNSATYTFDDLEIYAPDGSYWQYYVVERSINGYTTTVAVGDVDPGSDKLGAGAQREGVTGTSSADLCEATDTAVTDTVLADDTTPDVTFQNTYVPGTVDLTGSKTWDDYNDIFGVRPTADEFKAGLTVERIGNGATTDITNDLQGTNDEEANYYAITAGQNSNVYRIDIQNVEEWAPDGTRWRYSITEDLSGMTLGRGPATAGDFYEPVGSESSTVSAGAGTQFRLQNRLDGEATVEKSWVDGEDPYGLRPDGVTVALQARTKAADGAEGDWTAAYTLLRSLAEQGSDLAAAGLGEDTFSKTLNDGNGWKGSWTKLPVAARQADGTIVSIEYRVVETAIGTQPVTPPTGDSDDYGTYHPYQPAQESWTGDAENGWETKISNTLETTKISATKTWEHDSLDGTADAWGTRPTRADNWEVTYLLQQKLGTDDEWHWLMEYGYEQAATNNPLAEGIVSQTISSTDATSATVTWDNLPECDASGKPYSYRVVEQVPGSYDLENGDLVATATGADDATYRFYVVSSVEGGDAGDSQSFTNVLRTTSLTGTKLWDDHGTGLAEKLTAEDMPQMTLYHATVKSVDAEGNPTSFGTAEQVKLKNGQAAPQPTWTEGQDGAWTFTYEDLPAANEDNVDYVYWAEEQLTTAEGYYPLYGSDNNQNAGGHDAAGTTVDTPASADTPGQQTNEQITNVATRFTLNKVSDFTPAGQDEPEDLRDIELTVYGTGNASNTVYAVWKDKGGAVTSTVWPKGTTNPATGGTDMTSENAGFIVGLPAGTYTVKETGKVPEGYAKAPDVTVTIANNGTITAQSGVDVDISGSNPGGTIEINIEDPVLRGHLKLTKYVTDDGQVGGANQAALAGAVFDLYQVNPNGDDLLVASGLTTDKNGVITTVNNSTAVSDDFKAKYDNKYTKLSDGLPEGDYYFLETDATTGAVMPEGDAAKSPTMTITQDTHYDSTGKTVDAQMANEDFSATVTLKKFDTETGNGIDNVSFQLTFTPEPGSATQWGTSRTYTTDSNGVLTLSGLEKGTYTLTEQPNQGYENNGFTAMFVIDEADDDQTYNIEKLADGADISFTVTSGADTFVNGDGIPNKPKHGSVTMLKTDANGAALNGATFRLERMNGTDWTTTPPTVVAEGLVSDRTYRMNDDNTALVNADGTEITATDGRITVTNLKWGTYRFVETTPAPGYAGEAEDGTKITSGNLTISRTQLNPTLATSAGAVRNEPTSLELNKQNEANQGLEGAEFTVTPLDGAAFADPGKLALNDDGSVTLATNGSGLASLTGQLVVGSTYRIYESKAPRATTRSTARLTSRCSRTATSRS